MFKIIPFLIGSIVAISIAPVSQATNATANHPPAIQQTLEDAHAQIILKVRPQIQRGGNYNRRREAERRRQLELARERREQARREAERRRGHGRREYRR